MTHPEPDATAAAQSQGDHNHPSPGMGTLSAAPAGMVMQAALAEIVGTADAAAFRRASSLADLVRELEVRFGQLAGSGVAFRLGSACFRQIVRRISDRAGLTRPAFRLLPLPLRLHQGLLAFRGLLVEFGGRGIRVEEQHDKLFWRLQDCPICAGRSTPAPVCALMSGMLKEAVSWLSGGRLFEVDEIACRGRGDGDCVFLIAPVEQ